MGRYQACRTALLAEADRLVAAGVLHQPSDLHHLTLEELHRATIDGAVDHAAIDARRTAYAWHQTLRPPRVFTSEGECLTGERPHASAHLTGLGVSPGIVEGRARVVLQPGDVALEPGDILVTPFTDPSWTPTFLTVAGLVTEVGGLMTHGAVVAREYGLPAVVGVDGATLQIRDGQRIRVDGSAGTIVVLAGPTPPSPAQ
jgi:phosphoenolpyruvate synthase/pyruvate phosphate dikinase